MTTVNRKIRRETAAAVRSAGTLRPVIVSLEPPGRTIGLRLKGTRHTYYADVESLYWKLVKADVEALSPRRRRMVRGMRLKRY